MQAADGAVVVISGTVTPWIQDELAAMRARAIPVLPVLIGSTAQIPKQLADVEGIRLKGGDEQELKYAVQAIGERVKKMIG